LPTAWNLPFHVVLSGSQTSILMSESLDGVNVAAILQNAGSAEYGLDWLAPRPPPRGPPARAPARPAAPSRAATAGAAGGVNPPAATSCADVTCAF
jgi:hypothetical protein